MPLPGYLSEGLFSVYGEFSSVGQNNITAPSNCKFAVIDDVWNGGDINAQIGQSVLFKEDDVICRLAWDNGTYSLIPVNKILLTEQTPP